MDNLLFSATKYSDMRSHVIHLHTEQNNETADYWLMSSDSISFATNMKLKSTNVVSLKAGLHALLNCQDTIYEMNASWVCDWL